MKYPHKPPSDHHLRKKAKPVICYPTAALKPADMDLLLQMRCDLKSTEQITVAPRDAVCCAVKRGSFFRIHCLEGPQVGDLNLWNAANLDERFYSSKTRALYGTHLSVSDRMWSSFPYFRPITTITCDTLDWYGFDEDGASVHDVIGSRCDPYTHLILTQTNYHYCCHSNLTRALGQYTNKPLCKVEPYVHDVLNVFMCTGFTQDTHQYFMKASPVRKGDYIEFFAEIDLIVGLSTCPGGDCSTEHSSDRPICYPLGIEILSTGQKTTTEPTPSSYDKSHGT